MNQDQINIELKKRIRKKVKQVKELEEDRITRICEVCPFKLDVSACLLCRASLDEALASCNLEME